MVKVLQNQISKIEYWEKNIFWGLFSMIVVLLVSYGFLVNGTIINAISKQNLEKQMISLNSDVNSMEFSYLNIKNKITMEYALSLGFVPVSNDKFASISPNKNSLSLSINEN